VSLLLKSFVSGYTQIVAPLESIAECAAPEINSNSPEWR